MFKFKGTLINAAVLAAGGVALSGILYVLAAPTTPPANTSLPVPITNGSTAQTKTGPLTISNTLTVNQLCFNGGTCKSNWPASNISQGSASASGTYTIPSTTVASPSASGPSIEYCSYGSASAYTGTYYSQYAAVPFTITTTTAAPAGAVILSKTAVGACYFTSPAPTTAGCSYVSPYGWYFYATPVSISINASGYVEFSGSCLAGAYYNYYPSYNYTTYAMSASATGTISYIY
jgi:hypothetical protein